MHPDQNKNSLKVLRINNFPNIIYLLFNRSPKQYQNYLIDSINIFDHVDNAIPCRILFTSLKETVKRTIEHHVSQSRKDLSRVISAEGSQIINVKFLQKLGATVFYGPTPPVVFKFLSYQISIMPIFFK